MPPLRSGNGRHRRPRQAPQLLVTAGVTGAGLAIPLLGATSAQAADSSTWDRVAECESGGLWSANEQNGYYGGLQLTEETWERYGGTEYAERPDLASRGQQIAVAEKILDDQGPEVWSNCAESNGLTEDSAAAPEAGSGETEAGADEPVPERPYSSPSETAPADEGGGSDSGEGAAEDSADGGILELPDHSILPTPGDDADEPSESPDSSDSSGSSGSSGSVEPDDSVKPSQPESPSGSPSSGNTPGPDGEDSTERPGERPGTGKHRGSPAEDEHASRDGRDAGAGSDAARDHRVSRGESLSGIAAEDGVRGGWSELYERNRDVVGSDPDLILPGQELRL
ncbi:MAG: transglycosylase family protein [Streptomyces sp.]|uniref:transglycosylase family protein n=1 Tax=Streptomyces sp. TaxID=1931 RepID=UPI003D6BC935